MSIVKIGNSILTTPCSKVTEDNYTKYLSKFLIRSIPYRKHGQGIASNQVNLPYRICSVKIGKVWKTFINPEIIKYYGESFINNERCLSIPKKDFNVNRFNSVDIVYRDTNYRAQTAKYSALTAIILQHELDHLDGVLISMKNN